MGSVSWLAVPKRALVPGSGRLFGLFWWKPKQMGGLRVYWVVSDSDFEPRSPKYGPIMVCGCSQPF